METVSYECPACGEIISGTANQFGQPIGPYHHCNGKPSVWTIRRIIREEIDAALKRLSDSASEGNK